MDFAAWILPWASHVYVGPEKRGKQEQIFSLLGCAVAFFLFFFFRARRELEERLPFPYIDAKLISRFCLICGF